jgi:hypothetical protein
MNLNPKNLPLNKDAKQSVTLCKHYEYALTSKSGISIGGVITFPKPVSLEDATQSVIQEAAISAEENNLPFDPFNLHLTIKYIGKTYKKT